MHPLLDGLRLWDGVDPDRVLRSRAGQLGVAVVEVLDVQVQHGTPELAEASWASTASMQRSLYVASGMGPNGSRCRVSRLPAPVQEGHVAATRSTSKAPLIAAAVIGVVAIVRHPRLLRRRGDGDDNDGDPAVVRRDGCTPLTIGASPEKQGIMQAIANDYNSSDRKVGDDCFEVTVNPLSSGGGEQILARGWDEDVDGTPPDVWSPAGSTWVRPAARRTCPPATGPTSCRDGESESVTTTPLVLAMPKPMAQALGWPGKELGWADVLALANDPQGWAAKGSPGVGQVHPRQDQPERLDLRPRRDGRRLRRRHRQVLRPDHDATSRTRRCASSSATSRGRCCTTATPR